MGLFALENEQEIETVIEGFKGNAEEQFVQIAIEAGIFFQSHAKTSKTYHDKSGNLKASTGFKVGKNGVPVFGNVGAGEGGTAATALADELLAANNDGVVLIGVAGMWYGVKVEQVHGKKVISQSVPLAEKKLIKLLKQLQNENTD